MRPAVTRVTPKRLPKRTPSNRVQHHKLYAEIPSAVVGMHKPTHNILAPSLPALCASIPPMTTVTITPCDLTSIKMAPLAKPDNLMRELIEQSKRVTPEKIAQPKKQDTTVFLPTVDLALTPPQLSISYTEQVTETTPSTPKPNTNTNNVLTVCAYMGAFTSVCGATIIALTGSRLFLEQQMRLNIMKAILGKNFNIHRVTFAHKPAITAAVPSQETKTNAKEEELTSSLTFDTPKENQSEKKEGVTQQQNMPEAKDSSSKAPKENKDSKGAQNASVAESSSKLYNILLITSSAALLGISVYSYPTLATTYLCSLTGIYIYERISAHIHDTEVNTHMLKTSLLGIPLLMALAAPATGGLALPVVMYTLSQIAQPDFGSTMNRAVSGVNCLQQISTGQIFGALHSGYNVITGASPSLTLQQSAGVFMGAITFGYITPEGFSSEYCRTFADNYIETVSTRVCDLFIDGAELSVSAGKYVCTLITNRIGSLNPSKQVVLA